jgi:hypothetical protein
MVAAGVGVYGPGESPGTADEALEAVKLAYEVGGGGVNDVDRNGETALHGAVYRGGAVPVLKFLIEKGARLDVENSKKWSPLFAAEGVVYASSGIRRYPDAAALLREAMRSPGGSSAAGPPRRPSRRERPRLAATGTASSRRPRSGGGRRSTHAPARPVISTASRAMRCRRRCSERRSWTGTQAARPTT